MDPTVTSQCEEAALSQGEVPEVQVGSAALDTHNGEMTHADELVPAAAPTEHTGEVDSTNDVTAGPKATLAFEATPNFVSPPASIHEGDPTSDASVEGRRLWSS